MCIYLTNEDDESSQLIFGKARVTPANKKLSIPKLELLATFIADRALKFVLKAISLPESTRHIVWSDSKTVLSWITSLKILPSFIEHRVKEIRSVKNIDFRYVPSKDNPADIPSRGCSLNSLTESTWFNGPSWLHQPNKWPKNENFEINESISEEEEIKVTGTTILPTIPQQTRELFGKKVTEFKSLIHIFKKFPVMLSDLFARPS